MNAPFFEIEKVSVYLQQDRICSIFQITVCILLALLQEDKKQNTNIIP